MPNLTLHFISLAVCASGITELAMAQVPLPRSMPFQATPVGAPGDHTPFGTWVEAALLAINNSGDWAMVAAVDSPSLGFAAPAVLTSFGGDLPPRYQREVDGVDVTFLIYSDLDLNNHGDMAYSVVHVDPKQPTFINQLFYNDQPLIRSQDESPWNFVPGFGPVPYGGIDRVQLNDSGQALIGSTSPGLPPVGNAPNLITRLDIDGDQVSGVAVGGVGRIVEEYRQIFPYNTPSRVYGFNNAGQVGHGGLYEHIADPNDLEQIWTIDSEVVIRSGDPAPKPGTIYTTISSAAISLNNAGDWAMAVPMGTIQASRPHIIRNGTDVIIDPFEPQDSIGGLNIVPSLSGISLTDSGDVVYFADIAILNLDNTIEVLGEGLFVNDQPLVVLGETQIEGRTVTSMARPGNGSLFDISDNGQWMIAEVGFNDGSFGTYRFAIPAPSASVVLLIAVAGSSTRRRQVLRESV